MVGLLLHSHTEMHYWFYCSQTPVLFPQIFSLPAHRGAPCMRETLQEWHQNVHGQHSQHFPQKLQPNSRKPRSLRLQPSETTPGHVQQAIREPVASSSLGATPANEASGCITSLCPTTSVCNPYEGPEPAGEIPHPQQPWHHMCSLLIIPMQHHMKRHMH